MRRVEIGFVFQFFNLIPVLTARENAAMPMILDGVPRAEALRRAAGNVPEAAKLLGIGRATLYRKIEAYEVAR